MTFKKRLSPILRFIKSAAILFIPFSWWMGMSSKVNQLDPKNEQELENRQPDNYKRSDVDNELRGGIRFSAINLALTLGLVAVAMLVTPYVSPLLAAILPIVIGIGILPNFADFFAKQAIRAVSWIKNKDNSEVLNPTYPGKYSPYQYNEELLRKVGLGCILCNTSTRAVMKALYLKKKEIKNNPEGWWGLSDLQQEQCAAINLAVKHFRQFSSLNLEVPSQVNELNSQDPQQKKPGHRRNLGWFTKEYNFSPAMQQFLTETVNSSYGK